MFFRNSKSKTKVEPKSAQAAAVTKATESSGAKPTSAPSNTSSSPDPRLYEPENMERASELERRFGKVRSALGPGTTIQGKLSFDAPVSFDGNLKGQVQSSELILVTANGDIEAAPLKARILIIRGKVSGTIEATERIEVLKGGKLMGDIKTPIFVVEDGGLFDGTCKITVPQTKAAQSQTISSEQLVRNPASLTASL